MLSDTHRRPFDARAKQICPAERRVMGEALGVIVQEAAADDAVD